jgi:hypothetical protein
MAARRPCALKKGDIYFNEDQYWRGNRAGYIYALRKGLRARGLPDDKFDEADAREAARRCYQSKIAEGSLPAACPQCGQHHWPVEWQRCGNCSSGRIRPGESACFNCKAPAP